MEYCPNCNKACKSKAGLTSHKRFCKTEPVEGVVLETPPIEEPKKETGNNSDLIESIIKKLFPRIQDGKNRSILFSLRDSELPLKETLQNLKDQMSGGEAKGAIQSVIETL